MKSRSCTRLLAPVIVPVTVTVLVTVAVTAIVIAIVFVALLPITLVHAAPASESMLYGKHKPVEIIGVAEPTVNLVGASWWGAVDVALFTSAPTRIPVVALTAAGSQLATTCLEPTTTVGVQFLGDDNDGWVRITVDNLPPLEMNTWGDMLNYAEYIEITDLPLTSHTIQVEAMGESGKEGGDIHVTVVAFGCGALSVIAEPTPPADEPEPAVNEPILQSHTIYLPTIVS